MARQDILELDPDSLADVMREVGERPYRAGQILGWIFHRGQREFDSMSDLPKPLRSRLEERFCVGSGRVETVQQTQDGDTRKLLLRLGDGNAVECVSMREEGRHTVCVSSQVGCALGCRFCATGGMGFRRNLTTGEILLQPLEVLRSAGTFDRIVFMGMGEPLLNLDAVLRAVEGLEDPRRFGLGARRITISTSGVIPGIRALAEKNVPVRLAISLNSPFQEQRETLMPIAKTYALGDLLAACEDYIARTRRRVLIEYVLFRGVNSSRRAAVALAGIARRLDAKVNVIEYNFVRGANLAPPTAEETLRFRRWLQERGVAATIRFRRGRQIRAGCGQLAAGLEDGPGDQA